MPLHLTKIAFRSESPATLRAWLESHADAGEAKLTTRYLPKRAEALRARLKALEKLKRAAPTPELALRERALAQAELSWCEQLLRKHGGQHG